MYQQVALAEWLRRVPAKYMGFPRESSNLSGDEFILIFFYFSKTRFLYILLFFSGKIVNLYPNPYT